MPNLHDYIEWRGDIPFEAMGFSDVDNLVLGSICFIDLSGIVSSSAGGEAIPLWAAAEAFFADEEKCNKNYGLISPTKDFIKLFRMAAGSVRYRDIGVCGYVSHVDHDDAEQFGAVTYILPGGEIYIAFQGTDDSLAGWKENFLLSYVFPIRSQRAALEYLEEAASERSGGIYIGGHSKGGNLAFYSAIYASEGVKARIIKAWSNDGPGFYKRIVNGELYRGMRDRLVCIMPEESIVGRLFDNDPGKLVIMKCEMKGLLQHNPFFWQIKGGDVIHAEKFTDDSTVIRRAFRKYLSEIDGKGREDFVCAFFALLEATGAKTLTEVAKDGFIALPAALKRLSGLTKSQREMLRSFIAFLVELPI